MVVGGAVVISVSGGVVSMVKVCSAGVGSLLPVWSLVLTLKV